MSRKKEMRAKRQADKSALEADFAARPAPKAKRGRNLLNFLNSKEWFAPDQIALLEEIRRHLSDKAYIAQLATDLRSSGYSSTLPVHGDVADDKGIVLSFWYALDSATWPDDLSRAIWDKDIILGEKEADLLIRFLEINPFFFRSGYAKPRAIKRLRKCSLNPDLRRVAGVIQAVVESGFSRNLGGWLGLADLVDPAQLQRIVQVGLTREEPIRKRAIMLGLKLSGHTEWLGHITSYSRFEPGIWDIAQNRVCTHFGWQLEENAD